MRFTQSQKQYMRLQMGATSGVDVFSDAMRRGKARLSTFHSTSLQDSNQGEWQCRRSLAGDERENRFECEQHAPEQSPYPEVRYCKGMQLGRIYRTKRDPSRCPGGVAPGPTGCKCPPGHTQSDGRCVRDGEIVQNDRVSCREGYEFVDKLAKCMPVCEGAPLQGYEHDRHRLMENRKQPKDSLSGDAAGSYSYLASAAFECGAAAKFWKRNGKEDNFGLAWRLPDGRCQPAAMQQCQGFVANARSCVEQPYRTQKRSLKENACYDLCAEDERREYMSGAYRSIEDIKKTCEAQVGRCKWNPNGKSLAAKEGTESGKAEQQGACQAVTTCSNVCKEGSDCAKAYPTTLPRKTGEPSSSFLAESQATSEQIAAIKAERQRCVDGDVAQRGCMFNNPGIDQPNGAVDVFPATCDYAAFKRDYDMMSSGSSDFSDLRCLPALLPCKQANQMAVADKAGTIAGVQVTVMFSEEKGTCIADAAEAQQAMEAAMQQAQANPKDLFPNKLFSAKQYVKSCDAPTFENRMDDTARPYKGWRWGHNSGPATTELPFWLKSTLTGSYLVQTADGRHGSEEQERLWRMYGHVYGDGDRDWAIAKVTPNMHDGSRCKGGDCEEDGTDIKVHYSEFISEAVCQRPAEEESQVSSLESNALELLDVHSGKALDWASTDGSEGTEAPVEVGTQDKLGEGYTSGIRLRLCSTYPFLCTHRRRGSASKQHGNHPKKHKAATGDEALEYEEKLGKKIAATGAGGDEPEAQPRHRSHATHQRRRRQPEEAASAVPVEQRGEEEEEEETERAVRRSSTPAEPAPSATVPSTGSGDAGCKHSGGKCVPGQPAGSRCCTSTKKCFAPDSEELAAIHEAGHGEYDANHPDTAWYWDTCAQY